MKGKIIVSCILIFIIILFLIIKKKDKFTNNINLNSRIKSSKDIIETRNKLNLTNEKKRKGSTGKKGQDGDIGNVGKNGERGPKGKIGKKGLDGIDSGPIIFQTKEGKELGRYQPKGNAALNLKTFINVPNGIKGEEGDVGPIKFIIENNKTRGTFNIDNGNKYLNLPLKYYNENEIIGSYEPPVNSYASTIKPIIVTLPKGLKGDKGISGDCGKCRRGIKGPKGDIGLQGDKGERGLPGDKGDNGKDGGTEEIPLFNNIKINNKICFGNETNNMCLNNDLLNAIIIDLNDKYKRNYVSPLKRRELRLKKEICKTNNKKIKEKLKEDLYETLEIINPNTTNDDLNLSEEECKDLLGIYDNCKECKNNQVKKGCLTKTEPICNELKCKDCKIEKIAILDDGLIAHYKFDKKNNIGYDSSTNKNNLAQNNGELEHIIDNDINYINFNNKNFLSSNNIFLSNVSFSISLWCKLNEESNGYFIGHSNLFSGCDISAKAKNKILHIGIRNNSSAGIIYTFDFYYNGINTKPFKDFNKWIHLVFICEKISNNKCNRYIYRNSILETEEYNIDILNNDASVLQIGNNCYNSYLNNASLRDIRIYKKAINKNVVKILYLNKISYQKHKIGCNQNEEPVCINPECKCENGKGSKGLECTKHGEITCYTCNKNYYLNGNICELCPKNTKSVGGSDGKCIDFKCEKTNGKNTCIKCKNGYYVFNNNCIPCKSNACPANHFRTNYSCQNGPTCQPYQHCPNGIRHHGTPTTNHVCKQLTHRSQQYGPSYERHLSSEYGNYKYAWILSWREGNWYSYVIWDNKVVLFKNHGGPKDNWPNIWRETAEGWTSPISWGPRGQRIFRRHGNQNKNDHLQHDDDDFKCTLDDKKLSTGNYQAGDPFKNNNGVCGRRGWSSNDTWYYSVWMRDIWTEYV